MTRFSWVIDIIIWNAQVWSPIGWTFKAHLNENNHWLRYSAFKLFMQDRIIDNIINNWMQENNEVSAYSMYTKTLQKICFQRVISLENILHFHSEDGDINCTFIISVFKKSYKSYSREHKYIFLDWWTICRVFFQNIFIRSMFTFNLWTKRSSSVGWQILLWIVVDVNLFVWRIDVTLVNQDVTKLWLKNINSIISIQLGPSVPGSRKMEDTRWRQMKL